MTNPVLYGTGNGGSFSYEVWPRRPGDCLTLAWWELPLAEIDRCPILMPISWTELLCVEELHYQQYVPKTQKMLCKPQPIPAGENASIQLISFTGWLPMVSNKECRWAKVSWDPEVPSGQGLWTVSGNGSLLRELTGCGYCRFSFNRDALPL